MSKYLGLSALHPFVMVWKNMHARCYNENSNRYGTYGARGIQVDLRWHSFANFANDMWPTWRPGLQLDRIDNDANYSKENCQWVTCAENARKRTTSKLTQEQAALIRSKNPRSMLEQAALAKQFGVSTRMIRYVRDGKAWA